VDVGGGDIAEKEGLRGRSRVAWCPRYRLKGKKEEMGWGKSEAVVDSWRRGKEERERDEERERRRR
jgi:hypothetical protein